MLNIIDNTLQVVETAQSLPEAWRVIDVLDRRNPQSGPHTVQSHDETPSQPRKRSLFGRLFGR